MSTHQIDATAPLGVLPLDAAPVPGDLEAAVAAYETAERAAAARQLAVPDTDLAFVRAQAGPRRAAILARYEGVLAALAETPPEGVDRARDRANRAGVLTLAELPDLDPVVRAWLQARDLTPEGRARRRQALDAQRREELRQFAADLDARLAAAEVRAKTFGVPDPVPVEVAEADARVLDRLVRQKNELAPRHLVPVLATVLRDSARDGARLARQLAPFLRSWYESAGPLQGNVELHRLADLAGRLAPDRHVRVAERRLDEVAYLRWALRELGAEPGAGALEDPAPLFAAAAPDPRTAGIDPRLVAPSGTAGAFEVDAASDDRPTGHDAASA